MEERRLRHRPDFVCPVARGFYSRATRDQARDGLPGRHAEVGRQLADDFSIDPRRFAREFETLDADHLRRQFLGHARPGETGAEGELLREWQIEEPSAVIPCVLFWTEQPCPS